MTESGRRFRFPKPYADVVQRLRVPVGFVLAAAFLYFSAPSGWSMPAGLPVSLAGLWLRGWAAGHLEKNQNLARSGPYGHLRNPLYLGTLLVAAGLAVASSRWLVGAIFGVAFVLIYLPAIEQEEQHLRKLFPDYAEYAQRVPLLIPRWRGEPGAQHFRWELYKRNEEYQALLGFLAAVALLWWKAL